ncbi:MAG TPA: tRNA epoxyqueuosine(34) reductase QueG [Kiritimatiellia bacterium]|nr:tRNA epoxyqueuosine(34) reductase QueG [Kiritimatiellia bacterium]
MNPDPGISAWVVETARSMGFDQCAVVAARRAPRAEAYYRWLDAGYHAGMEWMAREPERRADPSRVLPNAASMVVVALSYFMEEPDPSWWNDPMRGRIARYAWAPDYHDRMIPMLRSLGEAIQARCGGPLGMRWYVDTGPVLEREHAERAGLGFIGKHTLLIAPRYGSYLLLGEILLDRFLPPYNEEPPESSAGTCGSCRRCQDICPTHAFPAPYILDSNRCISYLTIEHKGVIPEALRPLMGSWIYGCDECQSICPWVKKFSRPPRAGAYARLDPEIAAPPLEELLQLDARAFNAKFKGYPMIRSRRRRVLRNAAIALGNSGREEAIPMLENACRDPEPLIAEHARWALTRLRDGAIQQR